MQRVMKQDKGVYIAEFYWRGADGDSDFHVVAINCWLRCVFCNTLGAVPFRLGADGRLAHAESAQTHDAVSRVFFRVHSMCRVWVVTRI